MRRPLIWLAGFAAVALFLLLAVKAWQRELIYPMALADFQAQAALIQPGMSRNDVDRLALRYAAKEEFSSDPCVTFTLRPRIANPIWASQHINVYFDLDGRVRDVTVADG